MLREYGSRFNSSSITGENCIIDCHICPYFMLIRCKKTQLKPFCIVYLVQRVSYCLSELFVVMNSQITVCTVPEVDVKQGVSVHLTRSSLEGHDTTRLSCLFHHVVF